MSEAFDKVQERWREEASVHERLEKRKYVPKEFETTFQAMPLSGGLFGIGGLDYCAVCLKCGAMVYPSALDRHSKFHETMEPKL